MTEHTAKRPAAVTIIGLSFLSFSLLVIIYGTISIIGLGWLRRVVNTEWYVPPEEVPPVLQIVFNNFRVFEIITSVHMILAVFLLVIAAAFLRLRAWARAALEIVSWVGLFYTAFQGIAWPFVWGRAFAKVELAGFSWYGPFTLISGIAVVLASFVSLVFVIRALRGPVIRATMCDVSQSSGQPMPPCLPRPGA